MLKVTLSRVCYERCCSGHGSEGVETVDLIYSQEHHVLHLGSGIRLPF